MIKHDEIKVYHERNLSRNILCSGFPALLIIRNRTEASTQEQAVYHGHFCFLHFILAAHENVLLALQGNKVKAFDFGDQHCLEDPSPVVSSAFGAFVGEKVLLCSTSKSCNSYNPISRTWTPEAPMSEERRYPRFEV